MSQRPTRAGGHHRGAVANRAGHGDQAMPPLVAVGAALRLTPPARTPHVHGTIRASLRLAGHCAIRCFGSVRVVNDPDEEREPDRVGPKVAAGLTVAGAGVLLGPGAALLLGVASPLFESLAERAWDELRPDARRRAAQMLSVAAETAGCDAEQLGEMIGASEANRLQAGLAMDAAQRTAWPPQVQALGKVLAAGLISADDAVNVPQFALNAMVELERLHVTLLELLVRYEPAWTADGYTARPHREMPELREWIAEKRIWLAPAIVAVRPQLQPVLTGVAGTLVRHGLAEQTDRTPEALERLGRQSYRQAAAAESRRPRETPPALWAPRERRVERSWSPTELGEQVLGFYEEAGTEAD